MIVTSKDCDINIYLISQYIAQTVVLPSPNLDMQLSMGNVVQHIDLANHTQ